MQCTHVCVSQCTKTHWGGSSSQLRSRSTQVFKIDRQTHTHSPYEHLRLHQSITCSHDIHVHVTQHRLRVINFTRNFEYCSTTLSLPLYYNYPLVPTLPIPTPSVQFVGKGAWLKEPPFLSQMIVMIIMYIVIIYMTFYVCIPLLSCDFNLKCMPHNV